MTAAVRSYFGRYRIDPALHRDKITEDLSPDPGDRIHAAAAIYGDVDVHLLGVGARPSRSDLCDP